MTFGEMAVKLHMAELALSRAFQRLGEKEFALAESAMSKVYELRAQVEIELGGFAEMPEIKEFWKSLVREQKVEVE